MEHEVFVNNSKLESKTVKLSYLHIVLDKKTTWCFYPFNYWLEAVLALWKSEKHTRTGRASVCRTW